MTIVTMDTKALEAALIDLGRNQFTFAVSKGLNDLAIRAADAEREVARANFSIRNEGVLKYGIARSHTATKRELWTDVHVGVQKAGSREAFGYLKKFEKGGRKGPDAGQPFGPAGDTDTTVAVPTSEVRKSRKGVVLKAWQIQSLNLKRIGKMVRGDRRTFLLKSKTGRSAGVIVQRTNLTKKRKMGPHQAGHDPGLRVLYVLERSVPIRPILHFRETMERIAKTQWPDIWRKAITFTLQTAHKPAPLPLVPGTAGIAGMRRAP